MTGPYLYGSASIDAQVRHRTIGNYALGNMRADGFIPYYVGRSDTDLNQELKSYIGEKMYSHFMFSYAASAREAYQKECKNYHEFVRQLTNEAHPAKPAGASYSCPFGDG